jgi:ATP-dependent Clp protease ATP-binding subunit ClpA
MYTFERFTEKAKKVLTVAHGEAVTSHHSYIGTEHVLLGLIRVDGGLAARVLANLGVEIDQVRATIESLKGHTERTTIRQAIPTSRVKKVIAIAFDESKRMGVTYVGTEHLLLGLLIEGEGLGFQVLKDLGATLERVRDELATLPPYLDAIGPSQQVRSRAAWTGYTPLQRPPSTPTPLLSRLTAEARSCLVLAEEEGLKAGVGYIGGEHLLLGLLRQGEGLAARALGLLGVTLDGAHGAVKKASLDAPRQVVSQVTWNSDLDIVLKVATDLAGARRAEWTDTQDLLLALWMMPPSSRTQEALQMLGPTVDAVRASLGHRETGHSRPD